MPETLQINETKLIACVNTLFHMGFPYTDKEKLKECILHPEIGIQRYPKTTLQMWQTVLDRIVEVN